MTTALTQKTVHRRQRGAALIAVLVILVIITILGVTAMRMGITSLALATNSQVVQVLFQSADTGTTEAIKTFNQDPDVAISNKGIFGNTKSALCVTPVVGATFTNFTQGTCNPDSSDSYLSQRKITLTQLNYRVDPVVKELDVGSSNKQKSLTEDGYSDKAVDDYSLKLYSTAVIPSFGSASTSDIKTCLSKEPDDFDSNGDYDKTVETITDCLTNAGSVFTTHASEYLIKRDF